MIRWHTTMGRRTHMVPIPWDYGTPPTPEKPRRRNRYITINCGGRVYRVLIELLASKRNTMFEKLVGGIEKVPCGRKLGVKHYFMDRNPDVFHMIIHFYKTGRLHAPQGLCSKAVKNEVRFWRMRQLRLEPCCYVNYNTQLEDMKESRRVVTAISDCDYENDAFLSYMNIGLYDKFLYRLRKCFSYTEKKYAFAKNYVVVDVLATLLTVSLSGFMSDMSNRVSTTEVTRIYDWKGNVTVKELHAMTKPNSILLGLDLFLLIFFIVDQALRHVASHNRRLFFTSLLNLNDLFCNTMTFIAVMSFLIFGDVPSLLEFSTYLARSFRVLRLLRHCRGLMAIFYMYTARTCFFDGTFISLIFLISIVVAGTLMFFTDFYFQQPDESPTVTTFSKGYYWAATTLSAVGYGRYVPTCPYSYIVAVITAGCSMFVTMVRFPILTQSLCFHFQTSKMVVLDHPAPRDRICQRRKNIRIW